MVAPARSSELNEYDAVTNPYEPPPNSEEIPSSREIPGSVWVVTWLIYILCALAAAISAIALVVRQQPDVTALLVICFAGWLCIHQYRAVVQRNRRSSLIAGVFLVFLVPMGLGYLTAGRGDATVDDMRAAAMLVILALLPLGVVMLWWSARIRSARKPMDQGDADL